MAGDLELFFTDGAVAETPTSAIAQSQADCSGAALQLTTAGEGEAAQDLVQFAKDLSQVGVIMYGAAWCPACTQQKELFSDGEHELPFVEVTNPDRTFNATATAENITQIPTWDFPDGTRLIGVQSLDALAQAAGISIPISDDPTFRSVGDLTVRLGSPLHVPIDAYDPGDGAVVTSVSVGDPSLLEATVLSGNRSLRIDMNGYGDMVFELFEGRAPRAAGRVAELANEGFYNGIIFHRVVNGFVLQAGDPTGTGSSGSDKGTFDDDFHPDLQHNTEGILSFAKTTDDTNNSQFFITETDTRFLDFNHSIFGQLVEGFDVREAISETAVTNSRPTNNITIESASAFTDNENSVVMLKAIGNQTGSTTVTFTVTDANGNTFSETVNVTIANDVANSQPFLNEITAPIVGAQNQASTLQLSSLDVEGDAVTYFANSTSQNATVQVDSTSGLVTVTPTTGFTGSVDINVGVRPGPDVTGNGGQDNDNQRVSFTFEGESITAPTSIDLQTGSDTGASNIDNVTNAGTLTFQVTGVADGQTVELFDTSSNVQLGQGVANSSTVSISIDNIAAAGDGTYTVAARSRSGSNVSVFSPSIDVVYDSTAPSSVVSSAVTTANVDRPYLSDLINDEEGSGLTYTLVSGPSGATINTTTGVLNWTPSSGQVGTQNFDIRLTDLAGNTRQESFDVTVAGTPVVEIALGVTDLQGNTITSVSVGQEFLLTFTGVDARLFTQPGVFAAYADILFDNTRVRPVPGVPIQYESLFSGTRKGTIGTSEIDELGAFAGVTASTDQRESLIATIRMEAVGSGTTVIRSESADETSSATLLFGNDDTVLPESIAYGSVQLTVGQSFIVNPDTFTVLEDSGTTTLDVLANDIGDANSGQLSIISVDQPSSGGTVALAGGTVTFTPDANFNGQSVFVYRVSDANGVQDSGSVTVTVTPVNDPPTGVEDTLTISQNSGVNTLNVLTNDSSDPDGGETLLVTNVSASNQGATVSVAAGGSAISYTPASGFTGTDTLTYTLSDGTLSTTVSVNVEVVSLDNPPTATNDTFSLSEDDSETSFDVLANDTRDTDNESFVLVNVGTPSQGGSVRISSNGTQFFYAPSANFNGTETVTYTIRDSGGGTDVGTVTFQVAAVNDPPPAGNLTVNTNRGQGEIQVFEIDNATNPDAGETLSVSTFDTATAQGGSVRVDSASGVLFYTPPSDTFSGTDTFNYTIADSGGLTTSGAITIEVSDFATRSVIYELDPNLSISAQAGIRLKGTNAVGQEVDVAPALVEGKLEFQDLLPGEYRIEVPANPFLVGGEEAQSIPVSSGTTDGDTAIQSDLGALRPEFISIRDFLRSTPRKNLLVAVAPGQETLMTIASSAVDTIRVPIVALDQAGATLTIRGTRTNDSTQSDEAIEATVRTSGDQRVQFRGEANGLRLYKIQVDETAISFSPSTVATSAQSTVPVASSALALASPGSGEGESSAGQNNSLAAQSIPSALVAARSVSRTDVFLPTVAPARFDQGGRPEDGAHEQESLGEQTVSSSSRIDSKSVGTIGSQAERIDAAIVQVGDTLGVRSTAGDRLAPSVSIDPQGVDRVLNLDT